MSSFDLHVTHFETFGPYLKIYGYRNVKELEMVRNVIQKAIESKGFFSVDPNWPLDRQRKNLNVGKMCVHRRLNMVNGEILRARISRVFPAAYQIPRVEVEYIDYGHKAIVSSYELLFFRYPNDSLYMPPLAAPYIVLGILKEFTVAEIKEISRIFKGVMMPVKVQFEECGLKFVSLTYKGFDFADFLIYQQKLGAPISNTLLRENVKLLVAANQTGQSSTLATGTNNNNILYHNKNRLMPVPLPITPGTMSYGMKRPSVNERLKQYRIDSPNVPTLARNNVNPLSVDVHPRPPTPADDGDEPTYADFAQLQQRQIFQTIVHRPIHSSFGGVATRRALYYGPTMMAKPSPSTEILATHLAPLDVFPAMVPLPTFQTNFLNAGINYEVHVSYVDNGPYLFSVQLVTDQKRLVNMMNDLETIELRPLQRSEIEAGMACVARFQEDNQLYRGVIVSVTPSACKVIYVDYGNVELVTYDRLYAISERFLMTKPFAVNFMLDEIQKLAPIDDSLKRTFKDMVLYKTCMLTVLKGAPTVQKCHLFLNGENIFNMLKAIQKARLSFPKAANLVSGERVEIRYVDSPKHFYVQKVENIEPYSRMMDEMFIYYNANQRVPEHLEIGAGCVVKQANEWYRAEVIRFSDTGIIVRLIDFGIEQMVTKNLLSVIDKRHLKMPRQAVQCCLKGFEEQEFVKDSATSTFEMMAEDINNRRTEFLVRVFRIEPNGLNLINLLTPSTNMMKVLYKFSMPFERYLHLERKVADTRRKHEPQIEDNESLTPTNSTPEQQNMQPNDNASDGISRLEPPAKNNNTKEPQTSSPKGKRPNQTSNDWDKRSSTSSKDTRDSRSNASEPKPMKLPTRQVYAPPHQQQLNGGGHSKKYQNHQRRTNGQPLQNTAHVTEQANGGPLKNQRNNGNPSNGVFPPKRAQQQQQQQPQPQQYQPKASRVAPKAPIPRRKRSNSVVSERSRNAPQGYAQMPSPIVKDREEDPISRLLLSVSAQTPENYLPLEKQFVREDINMPCPPEKVLISWWISPFRIYLRPVSKMSLFKNLHDAMRRFYRNRPRPNITLQAGCNVVVLLRKEQEYYRARITHCNYMSKKYKVFLVDIGNTQIVAADDIWPVQSEFGEMPCLAFVCSLSDVIMSMSHLSLVDVIHNYFSWNDSLLCEFEGIQASEDHKETSPVYCVNLLVNQVPLRKRLIDDGYLIEVEPDIRLDLLVSQQIRATIVDVRDMLEFKIKVDGYPQKLLCCFRDLRFVKSYPSVAEKFKEFYDGKSCVIEVKGITEHKVLLVQPTQPLLAVDIPTNICTYPILRQTYAAAIVVYIESPYRFYVQLAEYSQSILAPQLDIMYSRYESGGVPLKKIRSQQICAARGSDGNWYRARVLDCDPEADVFSVYYLDYGNIEKLKRSDLKQLEECFYLNSSAYAVQVNLPLKPLEAKKKEAMKELEDLTFDVHVDLKILEVRKNRIIAEAKIVQNRKNLVDALVAKNFAEKRDLNYVRALLDEEPPNKLCEIIDLTLDEEDDRRASKFRALVKEVENRNKIRDAETKDSSGVSSMQAFSADQTATSDKSPATDKTQTADKASTPSKASILGEQSTSLPAAQESQEEPKQQQSSPTIRTEPNPYENMERGALSHCDSPTSFYLHPQDKLDELHKLQQNLQIVASSLPPLVQFTKNAYCISYYSVDKMWYRAKILDAELMVLKFIDFGHTDCVTDTSEIKEMSVFPDKEPLCIPCALPIKPKSTADWVDAANSIFNDSYQKQLYYEFLSYGDTEKRSYINLYIEGVNVAERLVQDGYAVPLETVLSGENCYISHVNGLTDFYIQYEKDSKALELIEIHLADSSNLKPLNKFESGKIVAALFADDGMWYRAKLLRDLTSGGGESAGYEVLFIDYGNTSISPRCSEISEEISKLPALSKKCALELPESCIAWSPEAEAKFAEISALGETTFNLELREPAVGHAVVHLYIDDHNINDDLEPLCEQKPMENDANSSIATPSVYNSELESGILYQATATCTKSPSEFYVQLVSDAGRAEDMRQSLPEVAVNCLKEPKVGQLCAAIFPDDNLLYRARIEEVIDDNECRVNFIDYGNESWTTEVRELPLDLQQLPPMCRVCRLENADQFRVYEGLADEHFTRIISEDCDNTFKVEFVVNNSSPAYVRLYSADEAQENIGAKLAARMEAIWQKCRISHGIAADDFYVQPLQNADSLEYVKERLVKSKAEELRELKPEVGSVAVVYWDTEDAYFRGKIVEIKDGNMYKALLIDSGHTIETSIVRELPNDLIDFDALAWQCKLDKIPEAPRKVLQEEFGNIIEQHFGETFKMELDELNNETNVHTVRLTNNYVDLGEELGKAAEKAKQEQATKNAEDKRANEMRQSLEPELHDCTVIHVNSPSSFYVQMAEDAAALDEIAEKLADAKNVLEPLKDIAEGAICAALYPEDMVYYRAKVVMDFGNNAYEVFYIDYGNTSITNSLLELTAELKAYKPCAKHCRLDKNFAAFADEATVEFQSFFNSRYTETFRIEILRSSGDELHKVRLYYQNQSVTDLIIKILNENCKKKSIKA